MFNKLQDDVARQKSMMNKAFDREREVVLKLEELRRGIVDQIEDPSRREAGSTPSPPVERFRRNSHSDRSRQLVERALKLKSSLLSTQNVPKN